MDKREPVATQPFATLLEHYFLSYMIAQKQCSPQTIRTYRDSFRLYFRFLSEECNIAPDKIEMVHVSLDYLSAYVEYLETKRKCTSSTINLRLSAIKSFLRYAAIETPEYSRLIRKALSLPTRKTDKPVTTFLTKPEYEAMLNVCNGTDALSTRDKMMLMLLYNTGCRISELIQIRVSDVILSDGGGTPYIRLYGKGRKERATPIWKSTASFVKKYIRSHEMSGENYLFTNARKGNLTRSGAYQRIGVIVQRASAACPSLWEKEVTPHTFRHSVAMNLLQAGVDISTIAIWLGHESIETTHKYMVADIENKRIAMEKMGETVNQSYRYKPSKSILAFLDTL